MQEFIQFITDFVNLMADNIIGVLPYLPAVPIYVLMLAVCAVLGLIGNLTGLDVLEIGAPFIEFCKMLMSLVIGDFH